MRKEKDLYSHISGVNLVAGQNDKLWDETGKDYIDFTSGIFCTNIGHSNPYIQEVFDRYTRPGALMHTYTFNHPAREKYLAELCELTGYPHAYLFSAGTEATEAAWRVMSRIKNRPAILGMGQAFNAFHGKTLGAQIMADRYPSHLQNQPPEKTCGIIMEPYDPLFARLHPMVTKIKIEQMIREYDFFLCLDEIQAGFGRTGKLFGYQHYDDEINPDFVCIGKGMGNGYPISGLLSREPLEDFELSSTHGGNPLACEIGSAVIKYFQDNDVIEQARLKGAAMQDAIEKLPIETHGIGLVAALVFKSPEQAGKIVVRAARRGLLLVHTGYATVKIGPPLTIYDDNLNIGLEILKQTVSECLGTSA
jgi:acetylornithine/succinyldiaminopimelate/putrescine aminotransferase